MYKSELTAKLNMHVLSPKHVAFKDALDSFSTVCMDVLDHHAPIITKVVAVATRPKWMDKEFIDARKTRRRLYKKWKRTRLSSDRDNFLKSRCGVNTLVTLKRQNYYIKSITECNNSQRELYRVCSTILDTHKVMILPECNNAVELANRFNIYFLNKIANIRDSLTNSIGNFEGKVTDAAVSESNSILNTFRTISNIELKTIIKSKKIKTSIDDPIPAALLGNCLDEILPVLVYLVNLSLSTGSIDGLKRTGVTPLLKRPNMDP